MALPAPAERKLSHTRAVTYHGYQRTDGLWDIEAHMRDTKPFAFEVPGESAWGPNEPIHDMQIRLTVDENFEIREVAVAMNHLPHDECPQAMPPMQKLVGARLSAGWRRTIEEQLGGGVGCTHLRELLFNMATAAFQTMYAASTAARSSDKPPPHLGRCVAWDFNTELVKRRYPQFHGWQPIKRVSPVNKG
ncbi:MAG: hypothetical protein RLZZ24_1113 [Pseudomonadota bacterium]